MRSRSAAVQVQIAPAEGHRLLVHIQGDAGRRALLGGDGDAGLLRGAAAKVNVLLAWTVAGAEHVGQELDVLVEGLDAEFPHRLAGHRLHGNAHVLCALGALGGGDDHLLDGALPVFALCGGACQGGRNRDAQLILAPPLAIRRCSPSRHYVFPTKLKPRNYTPSPLQHCVHRLSRILGGEQASSRTPSTVEPTPIKARGVWFGRVK